ncbi:MAG: hypothetical protein E7496_07630 [Ruminococcus sp.]|nr:hypothetical protein [Ruminococcus sp.]
MIKIQFQQKNHEFLNIEKILNLQSEIDDYLVSQIAGLEFEASDNEADLDDNLILYFSGQNETELCHQITALLCNRIQTDSNLTFAVTLMPDF